MEGLVESLIYLLIAVVVLVMSMKGGKKKEPAVETTEEYPAGDDVYEPAVEKQKPQTVKQPVTSAPKGEKESPWISDKEAKDSVLDAESVLKEANTNPIAQKEVQEEDSKDHYGENKKKRQVFEFDLKKAVIYNALLDRQEY